MRPLALTLTACLAAAGALAANDPTPAIRGHFKLQDARTGRNLSQESFPGQWRLVFFGFTHCPLSCPLGMQTLSGVLSKLGDDAGKLQALFITIDPERDTPGQMATFLKNFDPRIIGLVGSRQAVDSAMRDFRLEAQRMGKGGNTVFDHPQIIYLMGKNGEYLATLPSNGDPIELAASIRKAMKP